MSERIWLSHWRQAGLASFAELANLAHPQAVGQAGPAFGQPQDGGLAARQLHRVRGTIRAFHKHHELRDWFHINRGSAKFVLKDDRPESPTHGEMMSVIASARRPRLIVGPPGVYHGWMSLEDNTEMISTASYTYNREKPDEVRAPPDTFGDVWTVKGR